MSDLLPLVAVSLKMYLGVAATRAWVAGVLGVAARLDAGARLELAVLPSFPLLESTAKLLAGSGVRWGAQDVAPSADGAQTGEVSIEVLADLGCRYVEVGHVERRQLFGEDDAMVQAKVGQVVVAYEPAWAIGAGAPAPADYVTGVCEHLRARLDSHAGGSRVLYGGSAGPGTYRSLGNAIDGLFLGRFAHDTWALAQVVTEVITSGQSRIASLTSSKEQS